MLNKYPTLKISKISNSVNMLLLLAIILLFQTGCKDNQDGSFFLEEGHKYYAQKNYGKAVNNFKKAATLNNTEAQIFLGVIYIMMGK